MALIAFYGCCVLLKRGIFMKRKRIVSLVMALALILSVIPNVSASAKVKLSTTSKTLVVGKTATIKISGTKSVKWSVSNKKIKIIKKTNSYAKVKAISVGTAYLNAKVGKKTYKCKFKISKKTSTPSEPQDTPSATSEPQSTPSEPQNSPNKDNVTFDKEVIYSKNDCEISVFDGDSTHIKFLIKNNSSKDYDFSVHSLSVNGYMTDCNPYTFSQEVASGKKTFVDVTFKDEWLSNINEIEYIDVIFWTYDNAKDFKDFETDILKAKTNYYKGDTNFDVSSGYQGSKNIYVHLESMSNESIVVSVVNKNDYYVDYDLENTSINGWTIDTFITVYDIELYPNSKHIFTLPIKDEWLTDTDITEINNFEFNFTIRKNGSYYQEEQTEKFILQK